MLLEETGLTNSELKKFEQQGLVKGVARNDRGWVLYNSQTVEALKRLATGRPARLGSIRKLTNEITYTSEEAVSVFEALRAGKTLEEIIIRTRIHPSIVQVIVKDYQHISGSIVILKPVMDEINRLPLDGPRPIRSATEMLEVLRDAAGEQRCSACTTRRRSRFCPACLRDKALARERKRAMGIEPPPDEPSEPSSASSSPDEPADTSDASDERAPADGGDPGEVLQTTDAADLQEP